MSAKFTPGPWVRDSYGTIRAGRETLRVNGVALPCGGKPSDFEEVEANSRLIVAAPELLAAALNALDIIRTERNSFVDCSTLRDVRTEDPVAHGLVLVREDAWIEPADAEVVRDFDRAISLLETAIAKAEGA